MRRLRISFRSAASSAGPGEIYWLIQGFAAWIVAPLVLGTLFVPNLFGILHSVYASDPRSVLYALLFGCLWGIGGLTFGLAIRYLGIALGYAIALGLCAAFGTVVRPLCTARLVKSFTIRPGSSSWRVSLCA